MTRLPSMALYITTRNPVFVVAAMVYVFAVDDKAGRDANTAPLQSWNAALNPPTIEVAPHSKTSGGVCLEDIAAKFTDMQTVRLQAASTVLHVAARMWLTLSYTPGHT